MYGLFGGDYGDGVRYDSCNLTALPAPKVDPVAYARAYLPAVPPPLLHSLGYSHFTLPSEAHSRSRGDSGRCVCRSMFKDVVVAPSTV